MHEERAATQTVFGYPDSGKPLPHRWNDLRQIDDASSLGTRMPSQGPSSQSPEISQPSAAEESQRRFAAGLEQGIREGRDLERQSQATEKLAAEERRIVQAAELIDQIARERNDLLASVEQQVVKLALAIAEKVLRREAQLDPLFLVGAVRVALGQLAENMHVVLRIPTAEAELWRETFLHIPNLKVKPEIVADPCMQLGDCGIASEMGSVDLGLDAQLQSVQRALLNDARATEQSQDSHQNRVQRNRE